MNVIRIFGIHVIKWYPKMPAEHVKSFVRSLTLYILVMVVAVMVMGVVYREVSKYLGGGLPEEAFILATHYLSLVHGHTLSLGVVIPSAILLATLATDYVYGISEGAVKSLRKGFIIYALGSIAAISLLLYKGIGVLYYYAENPYGGLTKAAEALFMGNHALREALYGVAHTVMFVGLMYMVLTLVKRPKQ